MLDPNSAVSYALSVSRWRASGLCLEFVDHCFGQPGSKLGDNGGPTNGAWQNAKDGYYFSKHQHAGDSNPPAGVPCYWETGPSGNTAGHIVVSLGGGMCRTTDYAGAASVSTASIKSITAARNGGYLGWTEDFGGNPINLGNANSDQVKDWFDMATQADLTNTLDAFFSGARGQELIRVAVFQNDISTDAENAFVEMVQKALSESTYTNSTLKKADGTPQPYQIAAILGDIRAAQE